MKKKIMAMLATTLFCATSYLNCAATTVAADSKDDNAAEEFQLGAESTTVTNDNNDDANSTPLEELNRKGEILFGEFQREKAVLLGEYDANSPRLTLDKAEQYISESGSYDEFYKKLSTVQACPDFIGGSGIINIEYWFDDNGSEKLLLLKQQKDVIYVQCDEKRKITNWQLLYSVENEIKFETYKTAMIDSCMIYNDVDASGDVNDDGDFNISDVVLLQKWLLAVPDTNLGNWKAADFCKDNKLNVFNLCLMKRALIEKLDIAPNNDPEINELLFGYSNESSGKPLPTQRLALKCKSYCDLGDTLKVDVAIGDTYSYHQEYGSYPTYDTPGRAEYGAYACDSGNYSKIENEKLKINGESSEYKKVYTKEEMESLDISGKFDDYGSYHHKTAEIDFSNFTIGDSGIFVLLLMR